MNEERIWLLLSLQLSNEATPEEITELEALLQQHPGLDVKAKRIINIWQSKSETVAADTTQAAFDRHLQRLSNQLTAPALQFENAMAEEIQAEGKVIPIKNTHRKWYWMAAGAAAVVVILFSILSNNNKINKATKLAENTVSTKAGSKSKIQLPDGTQVWLNADSKIEYNENFNVKLREVKLTGEAFFDVVKNKEKPFVIHTTQMDVKVLGTAFNVRSYPDEATTETALLRGAVEVSLHNNPEKKYYLKPNDKLVLNNNITAIADNAAAQQDSADKQLVKMKKVHIDKNENDITETMWVKNKLAFDNELLEKILAETERWYNVDIELKNEKVKSFRFTSVFENKPLTDVLEALCLAAHLHYQVKGSNVTIW
ncbi:FecR family protein [Ferruginibacter sp. SUN106]|uniref:FecR family protein n=1 Tax=Ferruginibacter sp. SUN106 TaxID=2978348 RepID=UPI003D35DA78